MYPTTWFRELVRHWPGFEVVLWLIVQSGLTQACLDSPYTLPSVEDAVLDYIRKYIPEKRVGVLAGNSVHVDRMFLSERMPSLLEHLHYRYVLASILP